jgi:hypothetical protein
MFAGICSLEIDQRPVSISGPGAAPAGTSAPPSTSAWITAMVSRQGEVVRLIEPVSVAQDPAVNAWLSRVELAMQRTLVQQLEVALAAASGLMQAGSVGMTAQLDPAAFSSWVDSFAAQTVVLATSVQWCAGVEAALASSGGASVGLDGPLGRVVETLRVLATSVGQAMASDRRCKFEQLITEMVYQRDTTRHLKSTQVVSPHDFEWLHRMRYYWLAPGVSGSRSAGT